VAEEIDHLLTAIGLLAESAVAVLLQPLVCWLGFWLASTRFPERRFAVALGCGALAAHLGWALLHLDRVAEAPMAVLDPTSGFSVLFVPLGLLIAAPWRDEPGECARFLCAGARALVPALALARVGCLLAGCCVGVPLATSALASLAARHPVALYELAGLGALALALQRVDPARVAPAFLLGFGALRLVLEPLRAPPPLGEPVIAPSWIAAAWLCAGTLWLAFAARPTAR
jgi:hypothetical protein